MLLLVGAFWLGISCWLTQAAEAGAKNDPPAGTVAPADDSPPLMDEDLYLKMLREELENSGSDKGWGEGSRSNRDSSPSAKKKNNKREGDASTSLAPEAEGPRVFKGYRVVGEGEDETSANQPAGSQKRPLAPAPDLPPSDPGDDELFLEPAPR